MQKAIIFLVIFFISLGSSGQRASEKFDSVTFIRLLSTYSKYWEKDSTGESGFRRLAIRDYLKKYNFKGMYWGIIEKYFGLPTKIIHFDDNTVFRYRVTDLGDMTPGQAFFDIKINSKNKVIDYYEWYVDG